MGYAKFGNRPGYPGKRKGSGMTERNADKEDGWLIFKSGRGWYRPEAAGYTLAHQEAGRYTWDDAWQHSHPNGEHGPRDGMSIHHESDMPLPQPPEVTP